MRAPKHKSHETVETILNGELAHFEEFWKFYPRPVAKKEAARAYRAALAVTTAEKILAATKAQLADFASRPIDKIPHPTTWLNQERFNDRIQDQRRLVDDGPLPPQRPWNEVFRS